MTPLGNKLVVEITLRGKYSVGRDTSLRLMITQLRDRKNFAEDDPSVVIS